MRKNIARIFLLASCLVNVGCSIGHKAVKQEAVRGTLLDSESKMPLKGAYVILRWDAQIANFPSAYTKCVHVAVGKTDSTGQFLFQDWDLKRSIIDNSLRAHWVSFVPGYETQSDEFRPSSDGVYFVKRSLTSTETWVRSVLLTSSRASCGNGGDDAKAVVLFLDDLLQTIESIPGASAPVDIHGTMATARVVLHDRKCVVLALAAETDHPKENNTDIYDQCIKQP